MARGHPGIPAVTRITVSKREALALLQEIDEDDRARERVLALEVDFRERIHGHVATLPLGAARFEKFGTSPFVLLIHAMHRDYRRISEIEADILPAKLFSSMETSAGRMVEAVVLPRYGWECVASGMHTPNSALDGRRLDGDTLRLATLKSGPRCLNDEMSENFADAIIANVRAWATDAGVTKVDFTYGVLYGTERRSNKKDWHILRNLEEKLPAGAITQSPIGRWDCSFTLEGIDVCVTVRIGSEWWQHLGGRRCLLEMLTALIRACVQAGRADPADHPYVIADLAEIVSLAEVDDAFNVSLLQRSQLAWLFLMLRHFGDDIVW